MANNKYLLTWDGSLGRIISRGHKFTTNEKFDLSFPFDLLYYEPITNNCFKVINGERFSFTLKEIRELQEYSVSYINNKDYEVFAYDESSGIFEGKMLKSEAIRQNFNYRLEEYPSHPASKWVEDHWEKIKATILDDGTLVIDPPNICSRCLLAMTEEEFNKFPKQPNGIYIWDFIENKWIDKREIEGLKEDTKKTIRTMFETVRWNIIGEYVPQYEQETWKTQTEEAKAWIQNSAVETPYIDMFLNSRTDPKKPSKEELCKDILDNHKNYLEKMAKINAVQWKYLKMVDSSESNNEIDKIQEEARYHVSELLKNKEIYK